MGTYYIPSSDGWGADNATTKVRIRVDTQYNDVTNKSSVTLTPQASQGSSDYARVYNMGNRSYFTANGQSLISATGSDDASNGYSFDLRDDGWHDISGTNGFSLTVDHDDNGNATVSVTVYFRVYSNDGQFRSWSKSGSESWQETRIRNHTLTINAAAGSTVTVTRAGVALQNGATIRDNDILTVTFGASAGYELATHTVNGVTTASGSTVTVTGDVTVAATANSIEYTLILSTGPGSTVTVTRAGVTLQSGATIRRGDILTVTFGASAGYELATHTVNGVTTASGSTVSVTGSVTVAATASAIAYALSINAGTGTEITVQRISSPKQGANLGALTDGAVIYDGDVIRATVEASAGYVLTSATLNGRSIPENHTVGSNVTVAATAEEYVDPVEHYTLSISTGTGSTATVIRANERLISGAVLATGDILSVYFAPETGFVLETCTVNGLPFISGGTLTVSGDVAVSATATEETKVSVSVSDLWHDKPTFFQWETDRVLVISGTEKPPFLRFANCILARALVVKAEYSGSEWLCKVPNIMLQYAGDMAVSVVTEEDTGETREIAAAVYRVRPRVKPQDYDYTENIGYINWVAKSEEVEQLLEQLRIAVEANATAAESAERAAGSALDAETQAAFASNAAEEAETQKEAAIESASAAALSATQAAASAQEAAESASSAEYAARAAAQRADNASTAKAAAEIAAADAERAKDAAQSAKSDAETARDDAESAQDAAETAEEQAEAWAVGTRNGVPVAEEDEAYQNNAKFYAEFAGQQAATGGFLFFEINSDGDLILTRTPNVPYDFRLEDGDLILEEAE